MIAMIASHHVHLTNANLQNFGHVKCKAERLCEDLSGRIGWELDNEGQDDMLLLLLEYSKLFRKDASLELLEDIDKLHINIAEALTNKMEDGSEEDKTWGDAMEVIEYQFNRLVPENDNWDSELDDPPANQDNDTDFEAMSAHIYAYRATLK